MGFKPTFEAYFEDLVTCIANTPSILKYKSSWECFTVSRFIECSMNLDIQFVKIQRMFNESSKKLECPTFQDGWSITHEGSSIYLNLQLVNLLA